MAPLLPTLHPAKLSEHVQYFPNGKRRKPPVDLTKCELMEMMQYACDLNGPKEDPRSKVVCRPILRLFRRCANGLTVETTHWEGRYMGI